MLANCQRNRLAIACRHNSACYIAEVFTFIALLLISCDSLALSHQTTCFYIDKNFISDCLETTTSCSYAMQGTTWSICLLVVHRDYSVSWSSKWIEKKSFSLIYLSTFSYYSFINCYRNWNNVFISLLCFEYFISFWAPFYCWFLI